VALMSGSGFEVRPATVDALGTLQAALAWAITSREAEPDAPAGPGAPPRPASSPEPVIRETGHSYLLKGWGRAGDAAVVAETDRGPVGAAWYRFWTDAAHSYGYVDAATPELGIGVHPHVRGRGIGTALLLSLLETARCQSVGAVSLSVERDNPAVRLYQKLGFVRHGTLDNAWTMLRPLDARK